MKGDVASRLAAGDATLFAGSGAAYSLGWLRHAERYLGPWLDEFDERRPRRYPRVLVLGMGGATSPARLYAEARADGRLAVLDTSHPDTVAATDFTETTVVASSKSGSTIETQTLLAHALANGLEPEDLVVVTDPATALAGLAEDLGATLVHGDPETGGRFSGLSPFGLVPALYAGWTPDALREELVTDGVAELASGALEEAANLMRDVEGGWAFFDLGGDPITSGGALWLEQLVAESTGKAGRGFVPRVAGTAREVRPGEIQRLHLVVALLARALGVDPFDQPDVDSVKQAVFALLSGAVPEDEPASSPAEIRGALHAATYVAIQAYAPLERAAELADLRRKVEDSYGAATANFAPRYLHSTGQLHKGGPAGVVALQVRVRPRGAPRRIQGRGYSFHDLHLAQARADLRAMRGRDRVAHSLEVDDLEEAGSLLGLEA